MDNQAHIPVFYEEAVDGLNVRADGRYLDCTFGRGGHSQKILGLLNDNGRLVALDRDTAAIEVGRELLSGDNRATLLHGDFSNIDAVLEAAGESEAFDGILLDLGVSSPQLDEAERGFSFMRDGVLDMRMDQSQGETAAEWLAYAEAHEIANVIFQYGEEKFSRRIARAIVEQREETPINTTLQLAKLVDEVVPKQRAKGKKTKHSATRTFQAIRIYINDELGQIERVLPKSINLLAPSGRLSVISFHSLEDRIVKRFMRLLVKGKRIPKNIPLMPGSEHEYRPPIKLIGKALKPSDEEVARNVRARSAVLRVAERTEEPYAAS